MGYGEFEELLDWVQSSHETPPLPSLLFVVVRLSGLFRRTGD